MDVNTRNCSVWRCVKEAWGLSKVRNHRRTNKIDVKSFDTRVYTSLWGWWGLVEFTISVGEKVTKIGRRRDEDLLLGSLDNRLLGQFCGKPRCFTVVDLLTLLTSHFFSLSRPDIVFSFKRVAHRSHAERIERVGRRACSRVLIFSSRIPRVFVCVCVYARARACIQPQHTLPNPYMPW